MKKTLLLISAMLIAASESSYAFTALQDGDYLMEITSGCFETGDCQSSGSGQLVDNGLFVNGLGSSIAGDNVMASIGIRVTGEFPGSQNASIDVLFFCQDTHLQSGALGDFALFDPADGAEMSGTIDVAGNMTFDPTGRLAISDTFSTTLGVNSWNIDDSVTSPGGSGLYDIWTTGSSSSRATNNQAGFTVTGSLLIDAGPGIWNATLVSAGNFGQSWSVLDGTQYSEVYNIKITSVSTLSNPHSPVPVPAAVWLFGSGLIGLVGLARRKV